MRVWVGLWCSLLLVIAPQARASAWAWGRYSDAVTAAQPELYWRLGETQGTTIADAAGHGHTATLAAAAADRTRTGALVGDADSALGGSVVYYGSSYDLIRMPAATGLPTGDRTLEAWVWADNAGAADRQLRRLQCEPGGARARRLRRAARRCPPTTHAASPTAAGTTSP